jgi:hypothetical protein
MKDILILFLLFLIIVFFIGLYVYVFNKIPNALFSKESMENNTTNTECPDLLINKGNVILLYNSNKPQKEGENPIPFYNLDEYINYLEIQRKKGINCPILYLQKENDAQGNDVYRIRPSPFDQQGGLPPSYYLNKAQLNHLDLQIENPPALSAGINNIDKNSPQPIIDANRSHPPYNSGNYAGFDPYGLHQGSYTQLDKIHDSTSQNSVSDNPIDTNWGGVLYTQQSVDSGKYDDYNIYKPNYVTPKGTQFPNLYPNMPPPNDKAY